jgi:hypothetical protein
MPTQKLTNEILIAAIEGFSAQRQRLDAKIAELRVMLSGGPAEPAAAPGAPPRKRKKFSAAARRRMKEAQQRRWAKIRGESEPSTTPEPSKPKRRISEEGMKRIIAATKKRYRLQKAQAAKAQRAAKKAAPARKKAAVKKAALKKTAATKSIRDIESSSEIHRRVKRD